MSELDQLDDLLDGIDQEPIPSFEWTDFGAGGDKNKKQENFDLNWNDTDFEIKGTIGRSKQIPPVFDNMESFKFDTIKLPSFKAFAESTTDENKDDDNDIDDYNFDDTPPPFIEKKVPSKPSIINKTSTEKPVVSAPVRKSTSSGASIRRSTASNQSKPSIAVEEDVSSLVFDPIPVTESVVFPPPPSEKSNISFEPIDKKIDFDNNMFDPVPAKPKPAQIDPSTMFDPIIPSKNANDYEFDQTMFDPVDETPKNKGPSMAVEEDVFVPTPMMSFTEPSGIRSSESTPATRPVSKTISSNSASFSAGSGQGIRSSTSTPNEKVNIRQQRMSVAISKRLSKNMNSMFEATDKKEKQKLSKEWRMSSYIPKQMVEKQVQKLINIYLVDKTRKKLAVSMDFSVQEVIDLFSSKLDLIQNEFFSLAEAKKNGIDRWLSPKNTLKEEGISETTPLVFKIKYFKQPLKVFDPQAIHLFFLQVKQNVISGQYPASERLVIRLASYHFHSVYGPHLPQKHKPGFLGEEGLKDYLPPEVVASCSSNFLETRIYRRHSQLKKLSKLAAEQEYLEVARQIPTFGVTAFTVMDAVRTRRICVAEDGILISKKDYPNQYDYYEFHDLAGWTTNQSGFEIHVLRDDGKLGRHSFRADQEKSQSIIELISGYYMYYALIDSTLPKVKLPVIPNDLQKHSLFRPPEPRYIAPPGNSRLEIFRRSYLENCHVEGMIPSPHLLIQIDEILDEDAVLDTINLSDGKCDLLHLYVLKQSLSTISLIDETIFEGYEDNVMLNRINISNNPHLGPKGAQLMGEILEFAFPIKIFNASNTNIGLNGCKTLSHVFKENRILEELHLADCHLTGKGVAIIVKSFKSSGNLRLFDFSNNGLEDQVCKILGGMVSSNSFIKTLILARNKITDSGMNTLISGLVANKGLLYIDLSMNPVGSKVSFKLAEWISTSYQLNGVNFSGLKMKPKAGKMIAKLLGSGASLSYLNLSNNLLEKSLIEILEKVKDSRTLKELHLSGNTFDSKSGQSLVDCFSKNNSLKTLALKQCKLSKTVLMSLAQTIMENSSLTSLDLSLNDMSNIDVAASIGDMFSRSTCLVELNISACNFTSEGIKQINKSLRGTPCLKNIGFSGNKVGKMNLLTNLAENLFHNSILENISLRQNDINITQLKEFVQILGNEDSCPNLDSVDFGENDHLKSLRGSHLSGDNQTLINRLRTLHFAVEF